MSCDAETHCITCSDEGLVRRVVETLPGALALCDDGLQVMTDLVGPVAIGEALLIHAGIAIARVER